MGVACPLDVGPGRYIAAWACLTRGNVPGAPGSAAVAAGHVPAHRPGAPGHAAVATHPPLHAGAAMEAMQ